MAEHYNMLFAAMETMAINHVVEQNVILNGDVTLGRQDSSELKESVTRRKYGFQEELDQRTRDIDSEQVLQIPAASGSEITPRRVSHSIALVNCLVTNW